MPNPTHDLVDLIDDARRLFAININTIEESLIYSIACKKPDLHNLINPNELLQQIKTKRGCLYLLYYIAVDTWTKAMESKNLNYSDAYHAFMQLQQTDFWIPLLKDPEGRVLIYYYLSLMLDLRPTPNTALCRNLIQQLAMYSQSDTEKKFLKLFEVECDLLDGVTIDRSTLSLEDNHFIWIYFYSGEAGLKFDLPPFNVKSSDCIPTFMLHRVSRLYLMNVIKQFTVPTIPSSSTFQKMQQLTYLNYLPNQIIHLMDQDDKQEFSVISTLVEARKYISINYNTLSIARYPDYCYITQHYIYCGILILSAYDSVKNIASVHNSFGSSISKILKMISNDVGCSTIPTLAPHDIIPYCRTLLRALTNESELEKTKAEYKRLIDFLEIFNDYFDKESKDSYQDEDQKKNFKYFLEGVNNHNTFSSKILTEHRKDLAQLILLNFHSRIIYFRYEMVLYFDTEGNEAKNKFITNLLKIYILLGLESQKILVYKNWLENFKNTIRIQPYAAFEKIERCIENCFQEIAEGRESKSVEQLYPLVEEDKCSSANSALEKYYLMSKKLILLLPKFNSNPIDSQSTDLFESTYLEIYSLSKTFDFHDWLYQFKAPVSRNIIYFLILIGIEGSKSQIDIARYYIQSLLETRDFLEEIDSSYITEKETLEFLLFLLNINCGPQKEDKIYKNNKLINLYFKIDIFETNFTENNAALEKNISEIEKGMLALSKFDDKIPIHIQKRVINYIDQLYFKTLSKNPNSLELCASSATRLAKNNYFKVNLQGEQTEISAMLDIVIAQIKYMRLFYSNYILVKYKNNNSLYQQSFYLAYYVFKFFENKTCEINIMSRIHILTEAIFESIDSNDPLKDEVDFHLFILNILDLTSGTTINFFNQLNKLIDKKASVENLNFIIAILNSFQATYAKSKYFKLDKSTNKQAYLVLLGVSNFINDLASIDANATTDEKRKKFLVVLENIKSNKYNFSGPDITLFKNKFPHMVNLFKLTLISLLDENNDLFAYYADNSHFYDFREKIFSLAILVDFDKSSLAQVAIVMSYNESLYQELTTKKIDGEEKNNSESRLEEVKENEFDSTEDENVASSDLEEEFVKRLAPHHRIKSKKFLEKKKTAPIEESSIKKYKKVFKDLHEKRPLPHKKLQTPAKNSASIQKSLPNLLVRTSSSTNKIICIITSGSIPPRYMNPPAVIVSNSEFPPLSAATKKLPLMPVEISPAHESKYEEDENPTKIYFISEQYNNEYPALSKEMLPLPPTAQTKIFINREDFPDPILKFSGYIYNLIEQYPVVTGGAITSLMEKDIPNDYDILVFYKREKLFRLLIDNINKFPYRYHCEKVGIDYEIIKFLIAEENFSDCELIYLNSISKDTPLEELPMKENAAYFYTPDCIAYRNIEKNVFIFFTREDVLKHPLTSSLFYKTLFTRRESNILTLKEIDQIKRLIGHSHIKYLEMDITCSGIPFKHTDNFYVKHMRDISKKKDYTMAALYVLLGEGDLPVRGFGNAINDAVNGVITPVDKDTLYTYPADIIRSLRRTKIKAKNKRYHLDEIHKKVLIDTNFTEFFAAFIFNPADPEGNIRHLRIFNSKINELFFKVKADDILKDFCSYSTIESLCGFLNNQALIDTAHHLQTYIDTLPQDFKRTAFYHFLYIHTRLSPSDSHLLELFSLVEKTLEPTYEKPFYLNGLHYIERTATLGMLKKSLQIYNSPTPLLTDMLLGIKLNHMAKNRKCMLDITEPPVVQLHVSRPAMY